MKDGNLPDRGFLMLIVLDIGNNHVTIGGFDGDDIRFVAAIATDEKQTGEQYACALRDVFALYGVDGVPITGVSLCSVVPGLTPVMQRAVRFLTDSSILTVGAGVKTGLNIKIDQPRTLGADRVAAAVHAVRVAPMPCVIVDLGTATTFTVLDESGALIGSAIAAGVQISLAALKSCAAQLPTVGLETVPRSPMGRTTAEAIQIGAVYGTAAMIDGMLARYAQALGQTPSVLLTGGMAERIAPCMQTTAVHEPLLALRGLADIWHRNHAADRT